MGSKVEGIGELLTKLGNIAPGLQGQTLRASVKAGIEPALHLARSTIPVGSEPHTTYKGRIVWPGFSQATVDVKVVVSKDGATAAALLGVAPEAFYATQFVEIGTSKMAAQPWLVPALEATQGEAVKLVAEQLRRQVERIAKRAAKRDARIGLA